MRQINLTSFASIGICLLGITYASVIGFASPESGPEKSQPMLSVKPFGNASAATKNIKLKGAPQKVAAGFIYHEDFEGVSGVEPYDLPEGWTRTATPGDDSDTWLAGTLYNDKGMLAGVSGTKYAFILPASHPHDAWMFSSQFRLEEGKEYLASMAIYAPRNITCEELSIVLADAQDPNGVVKELYKISNEDLTSWSALTVPVSVEKDGSYFLGFHATSPEGTNGLLIDEISVTGAEVPSFYGDRIIEFGELLDIKNEYSIEYSFSNFGDAPMQVSLKSCSDELSVEGLPVEVAPYEDCTLKVNLKTKKVGEYSGNIVLETNVPFFSSLPIEVTATIKNTVISSPHYETFDYGTPDGWDISFGSGNLIGKGIDKTRGWWCTTYYGITTDDKSVGIKTEFIEMGENPVFEFSYALVKCNSSGDETGAPVEADVPLIDVYITDDFEDTWESVYSAGPERENSYDGELGFHKVRIELPEYANKTCRARIAFRHASGNIMDLFSGPFSTSVDNVFLGTLPRKDLCVKYLRGTKELKCGETAKFETLIENHGLDATDFSLNLVDGNGNTILSQKGSELKYEESQKLSFEWTPKEAASSKLRIEIASDGDNNPADNVSAYHNVSVLPKNISRHTISTNRTDSITTSMIQPVNLYACKSATQTIYWANELSINKGMIHSLEYEASGTAPFLSETFEFYVGETDIFDYSESDFIDPAKLTKVFEGQVEFTGKNDLLVIPFDTPYEYKGGNLVVLSKKEGNEFIYGQYFKMAISNRPRTIIEETDDVSQNIFCQNGASRESYPCLTVNMVDAPSGSLTGKIVDTDGVPVKDAVIRIAGESTNRTSGENGGFEISKIAEGSYNLSVSKPGYASTDVQVEITKDNNREITVTMSEIQKLEVSGVVTDTSGDPVGGTKISFVADTKEETVTDSEGRYSLLLYDQAKYRVLLENPYFENHVEYISLNGNPLSQSFTLAESPIDVFNASASTVADGIEISWGKPLPQLRHDTGDFNSSVGFNGGFSEVIFGSAYKVKATVKSVSWYLDPEEANYRDNFNVFVFGLTDGIPDATKIIYSEYGVKYVDAGWNTHVLRQPLEADGFMVAVSCDGFMGIGTTSASEAYPYEYGAEYYAGDSYRFTISESGHWSTNDHFMLRAGFEQNDAVTENPYILYEIYRSEAGMNEWEFVGETEETSFTDKFTNIPGSNTYEWKVVASYANGLSSDGIISDSIEVKLTGIDCVNEDDVNAEYFTLSGIRLSRRPTEKGIYVMKHTTPDGKVVSRKISVK